MAPKIVFLIVYLTTFTSGAEHNPRVHEDQVERESGSVRTARNPYATQKMIEYKPHVFNYQLAQQQNYLKHRYAQQQKVDFRNGFYMRGPSAGEYSPKDHRLSNNPSLPTGITEEWQPFQPRITKQNIHRRPKLQIPTQFTTRVVPNSRAKGLNSKDLEGASSETVMKTQEIDRQDGPINFEREIVYVHPNVLNPNSISGIPDLKYNALNDLLGKNPNVQLEGLKHILLQEVSQNSPISPASNEQSGPKDHTPIVEKSIDIPNPRSRPNIHVGHEETPSQIVSSILQQSPAIDQNSLESLQKQLDEASNIQTQKVLEKAKQEAQAHVEAQHKAIENAQKAILQKYHLNEHPQALPLVQQEIAPYKQQTYHQNNQPAFEHNLFYPTPLPGLENNQNIDDQSSNIGNSVAANQHLALHQTLPIHSITKSFPISSEIKPVHHYPSKNVEFYAPNHIHQAAAQIQAEKALVAQVKAQNSEILKNYKQFSNVQDNSQQDTRLKVLDTFQQLIFDDQESGKENTVHKKSVIHPDEKNELQYAARYAFGYRIKDAKEGNDFGHQEKRNGKNAEGSYYVLLPDGRKQKVDYFADTSGYHAKVTYEHVAHHR
nr:uncharacterized protein LOC111508185 [Leptinotarsa decemlineata]